MSEASRPPEDPEEQLIPTSDPYPKMILVCMGIFLALVMVIFGFIFFDFMHRTEQDVRPFSRTVSLPAPASEAPPAS